MYRMRSRRPILRSMLNPGGPEFPQIPQIPQIELIPGQFQPMQPNFPLQPAPQPGQAPQAPPQQQPQFQFVPRPVDLGLYGGVFSPQQTEHIRSLACQMATYLTHQLDKSISEISGMVAALVAMSLDYDIPGKNAQIKQLVVTNIATWCG